MMERTVANLSDFWKDLFQTEDKLNAGVYPNWMKTKNYEPIDGAFENGGGWARGWHNVTYQESKIMKTGEFSKKDKINLAVTPVS